MALLQMLQLACLASAIPMSLGTWHANPFEAPKLMSAFAQIKDYERQYGAEMDVPRIVVVGVESAGKSTLLSAIVGLPLTFTHSKTGTRCPVRYRLRYGKDAHDPQVKVQGADIPAHVLPERVQKHMDALGQHFSEETFDVEIASKHVPDLELIDMPGIITNPKQEEADRQQAREVQRIQAKFVRNAETSIVAVVKCTERFKTIGDFKFLNEVATGDGLSDLPPRPNWRSRMLVVANRLNQQTQTWAMQDANEYFSEARAAESEYKAILFVALRPPKTDINPDTASYEEKKHYYENLEQKEKQWFEDLRLDMANASSAGAARWNEDNTRMFGLTAVKPTIVDMWREGFESKLPMLIHKMKAERKKSKERAEELQEQLSMVDLKRLRQKMKEFLTDFVHQYQALVSGESVKDLQGKDVTTFKLPRFHSYDPARYGKSFEDEMRETPINKETCPWLLSSDELLAPEKLGGDDQYLGEEMRMRYLGMASFERSVQIMEYMMIARNFDHVSDNNIRIMARGHGKHGTRTFPSNEVVLQIATDQVHHLNAGVEWYADFLQANFVEYMHPVLQYMSHSTQYALVANSTKFMMKLRQTFESIVVKQISQVVRMYANDVRRYGRFRALDMITKLHMASVMLPMESIIVSDQEMFPDPPTMPSWHANQSVPHQGQYVMPVDKPRKKKVGSQRELRKRDAILHMKDHCRPDPKSFNIADYVQGGFAQVKAMEWSMIDFDYLRHTAHLFYVRIATVLAELLRTTLHSEFIDYMLDLSEKTLMKDILNIESELDESELKQMVPIDPDVLRKELEDEVSRTTSLNTILHSLKQLREGLRPDSVKDQESRVGGNAHGSVSVETSANNSNSTADVDQIIQCSLGGEGCPFSDEDVDEDF